MLIKQQEMLEMCACTVQGDDDAKLCTLYFSIDAVSFAIQGRY